MERKFPYHLMMITYKYDALGRRLEKNVEGTVTRYLYDGLNILLELDGNNKLQARYTHGPLVDQPLMMERGGKTYFYHADAVGSIAAVTDPSGKMVCGYSYDTFGDTTVCQALVNPYSFAGREYDAESGLYYLRARYYDPSTGRFISNDPLDATALFLIGHPTSLPWAPQQLNNYSYAVNNPLVSRDPLGLKPQGPLAPNGPKQIDYTTYSAECAYRKPGPFTYEGLTCRKVTMLNAACLTSSNAASRLWILRIQDRIYFWRTTGIK